MSSAAARAEARRKAILSRGTDRLAKLTTSARGEDASALYHDDPPLAQLPSTKASNFLGEATSNMPPPPTHRSPSPEPSSQAPSSSTSRRRGTTPSRNANIFESLAGNATDPSVWLPEQQQQFMQALMNASAAPSQPSPFGELQDPISQMDNPLAALLGGPQAGAGGGAGMFPPFGGPGMGMMGMDGKFPATPGMGMEPPKEKTRLQKVMPLVHLVAMWCLLAYFVLWAEPKAFSEAGGVAEGQGAVSLWRRWAELGHRNPAVLDAMQTFKIRIVPFFWAFTTLQIILHSLRIFSGFDTVQPPTLLALALPHLPQPFPSLIINGLKYMQMGSLFLDDLSGIVVGIGFIIYFSGWLASSET